MNLEFSFLNCNNTINNLNYNMQPDKGLGLYVGNIKNNWTPSYIYPNSSEYIKHFYAKNQNPSYTRLGNSTEPEC